MHIVNIFKLEKKITYTIYKKSSSSAVFLCVLPPAGGGGALQPDAAVCGAASRHEGRRAGGHQTVQEDHHQLLPALSGRAVLLDHTHQVRTQSSLALMFIWLLDVLYSYFLTPGCVVPLSAFRVLLENDEDRLLVVFNRGLILMTEVRSESPEFI